LFIELFDEQLNRYVSLAADNHVSLSISCSDRAAFAERDALRKT
jgi:hypothetical protein